MGEITAKVTAKVIKQKMDVITKVYYNVQYGKLLQAIIVSSFEIP